MSGVRGKNEILLMVVVLLLYMNGTNGTIYRPPPHLPPPSFDVETVGYGCKLQTVGREAGGLMVILVYFISQAENSGNGP